MHATDHLTPDRLAAVTTLTEARLDAEDDDRPHLVRIRLDGDDVELGWRPLPAGSHPLGALLAFEAPDDWEAIGVACTGRARPLDDPDDPGRRVRTVHLVGRDGSWAFRVREDGQSADDAAVEFGERDGCGRPEGRIDDACRRALGLSTSPPAVGTAVLFAAQWLDAVVAGAVAGGAHRLRRWPAVAALHPAVAALVPDAAAADLDGPALARYARQLSAWRDWPVVRRACAAGTTALPGIDADVAAWLDDGAFSRWAMAEYPELDDLLDLVAALLPPAVGAGIDDVLAGSGVR